jgi:carboxypeptidase C (cathepsin A)
MRRMFVALAAMGLVAAASFAQAGEPAAVPPPKVFVSKHTVTIHGQKIAFTATAGETYINNDAGEPVGAVFSYAYVRDVPPGTWRPVTFVFGGGPGSASHQLQMGAFGPWSIAPDRLALKDGRPPRVTPPYDLVENQNSILDVSDLVFVDPIGTGYSRPIGKGQAKDFWGIDEDAESMAQFIQLWVTSNDRWNSPKFYAGESYGGYRAGPLGRALTAGPSHLGYWRGVAMNGYIIMVNHLAGGFGGQPGVDRTAAAAMELPTQAATAWYHQTVDRRGLPMDAFYAEAEKFAETELVPAVKAEAAKTLAPEARAAIVAKLAAYTGLPASAYAQKLTLGGNEFSKLALVSRGEYVGVYDSRFTLKSLADGGDPVADDPGLSRSFPVFSAAIANLERQKLGVQMDRTFVGVHWRDLLTSWDNKRLPSAIPGFPPSKMTVAGELAVLMNQNDRLRIMMANGQYDLLMPAPVADYVAKVTAFDHSRLTVKAYPGGHEFYINDPEGHFASDVRAFITEASK